MNNPFRHHRKSSSSDNDPFDVPENYYGDLTNPAKANKDSKVGRVRTFSVIENTPRNQFFNESFFHNRPETIKESPSSSSSDLSQSPTPVPELFRKPSIVPLYAAADDPLYAVINDDEVVNSQESINLTNVQPGAANKFHYRRASVDDAFSKPKKFYIADIKSTLKELLDNEDTDHNCQITIEDTGPKVLRLGTANSNGFKQASIRGTYMLSNLLQELTIARLFGRDQMILDEERLSENPVDRMKRLISTQFWKSLTRCLTKDNVYQMSKDTKLKDEYINEDGSITLKESHRIYIPYNRKDQFDYYSSFKSENPDVDLDIVYLPKVIDAEYIKSINKRPGLLALSSSINPTSGEVVNQPYVVPGGRFNELYGWDSYMETIGLLTDVTPNHNLQHLTLARGMTENFIYEIYHYGKILNANRSYYLGRSQPPFLTDMALRVFHKTNEVYPDKKDETLDFLQRATIAAIKEYKTVWCAEPRLDVETGLSCYHPTGVGIPPETEPTHFNAVLKPYIEKYNIDQTEFIEKYNEGVIKEPKLDEYFLHDRAVRESGHDTSYRLEGRCAYLATVDLNSLLYKYENDIALILSTYFGNKLEIDFGDGEIILEVSENWIEKARQRRANVDKYLWNGDDSIYYDYNIKTKTQNKYESATTFWPLWSELSTQQQADKMVSNTLYKLEEFGGLAAGTETSRGDINLHRPSRQWDYPYGWAPQQILAWIGLSNYGYHGTARRLAYRWLFMMTRAFVDYNGVVVEKYNVTKGAVPHKVDAEYGNQGVDFKGVATEGFGWVNASYLFGLTFMNLQARRALGTLTPPDVFIAKLTPVQKEQFDDSK
ncbi:neutral trehalase [Scheffersomyces coipomensis]|uniref:neutral trehalase n=1 Tax=Scheffersomyces coipomensis TaxID=1788519 RepID=UPI00315CCF73